MRVRLRDGRGEDRKRDKENRKKRRKKEEKKEKFFLNSTEFINHSLNNFLLVFLDHNNLYNKLENKIDNF